MSKRCRDPEYRCSVRCETSGPSESSSKKKRSRCHGETSNGPSSSSSSRNRERSKGKSRKIKKKCNSARVRKTDKKARIEHFPDSESTDTGSGTTKVRKRRKKNSQPEVKRKKTKNKKKNKKRRSESKNKKKLSGSSACSRLIELILKSCSCLESLDPSSSNFRNGDDTCRCCKCRFYQPDCQNKFVQCEDCDNFVATSSTRSSDDELCDSGCKTKREVDDSWDRLARDEANAEQSKDKSQLDFRKREEELSKIQSQKQKIKSDTGFRSSIVRSFSAMKNCGKRRISTKSLINEPEISENCIATDTPKCSVTKKILQSTDIEAQNCEIVRSCRSKNRDKSTKALLIMFDIVFWPYTCLPGRRRFENKDKNT